MTGMCSRLRNGFVVAVGVHLIIAALLGYFTFLSNAKLPPQIIEISLAGGGGGGGGTQGNSASGKKQDTNVVEKPVANDADAIAMKSEKQSDRQQVTDNTATTSAENTQDSTDTSTSTATDNTGDDGDTGSGGGSGGGEGGGNGTGNGTGTGPGSGSGSGGGNGSGEGSGSGSGNQPGIGVPITPPRFISGARPRYPNVQRNREVQGSVSIHMVVGPGGNVESASISRSSGNGELDSAALAVVYGWQFSPAKDTYGSPCRCGITMPVSFTLN
jgi:protein TonB